MVSDLLSKIPNDFDTKSEHDKQKLCIEFGGNVKLDVSYITALTEEYEDDESDLADLINEIDEASKKERKILSNRLKHLENKLESLKRKIVLEWDRFTDLRLDSNENIILISNGDSYYMTSVLRNNKFVQKLKEQSE